MHLLGKILIGVFCVFSAYGAAHQEGVSKRLYLANFGELIGVFTQTKLIHELNVEIKTEGTFKILKPNLVSSVFYWNIEKPKVSKICIDQVGLVIETFVAESPKKKYLKFSEVGQDVGDQILSLLKLMMMDQEKILQNYNVKFEKKFWLLIPKAEKGAFFKSAQLKINSLGLLDKIIIKEKSKDEIHLQFSNLKTKPFLAGADILCDH